ncbi:MAG: carbohydrate-binding protein [Paenibacillus sp.]|uniref:carbohydrate-binding protein n=1 Tax=Paenibacillus sp. TaxID=58172 RepID=UPI0029051133|nr:carbohydrate-binding protein [Paenibacillus sp.]MDU2241717.1 carbohydrate-binding protein [Paenibacillus sp.]
MNRNQGKRTLSKFLALTLTMALSISLLTGAKAPEAQAASFGPVDADAAIRAFNAKFWDPQAKYYWADSNRGSNYQGFWVEAELWEMVMDAYLRTSDPELKAQLRAQIDEIFDGAVLKYGEDWTNNPFNDDIMWWAMASARAYQITGEARYLDKAKYYFDFVYDTQWDDEFANGGLWWLNSEHVTKNACINFPAAEAAVFLYEITEDSHYLEAATRIYRWGKTMLTDGNGKVFDRIEPDRGAVPDATHYNQGTFIGAATMLHRVTGDKVYLEDAIKAAQFTMTHQTEANGLLGYEGPNGDLKGGKTILLRNLAHLQQAVDGSKSRADREFERKFDDWLAFNAAMAWSHRNEEGIVDGNWIGRLLSGTYESWAASSAVQALTVVQPKPTVPVYPVKPAYQRIEAEKYNIGQGFVLEGSAEGTLQLGGIKHGHTAVYKNVDFGTTEATGFIARAASGTSGGTIEIRLDAEDGPKIGTVRVEGTGGWNQFIDAVAVLKDDQGNPVTVTGKHDVYFTFVKANDDYLFNLNWFRFTETDPTRTDAYAKRKAGEFDASSGLSQNSEYGFLEGITNGAYVQYEDIDFGSGAAGITAHVASGNQGGTIEVKLDSLNGPTVGTLQIPAVGDWATWIDVMSTVDDTAAAGIHDVYLVFHGTDGSDFPCNLDWFSFTTVKGKAQDAYGKLEAESYTTGSGFGTEQGGGQTYLAGMFGPNQPSAMYNFVDFGDGGGTAQFHVNAASDTAGGTIEVRLDSPSGPVIAETKVTGTGGWQEFKVFSAEVTHPVRGKHIVFLLFKGSDWLFNLDKFTFGDPAVFTAPPVIPEPPRDHTPPGEVEHVRAVRESGQIRLYWDGPYDMDGTKVQIMLLRNKKQFGHTMEVARGVQTTVLPDVNNPKGYTVQFKAVDASGNVSKGYSVSLGDLLFK